MIVICPEPVCGNRFELDLESAQADKRGHYRVSCVRCGLHADFRTTEAMAIIEKEYRKKVFNNTTYGGPVRDDSYLPEMSVVVEDVRSLWNVGSMFRTSDGAGFDHVYLCGITGSPPRREIEKVSLGAENTVSWEYAINSLAVVRTLRAKGVYVIGLECTSQSVLLRDYLVQSELHKPLSVVVGNEVSGLSRQVIDVCDVICHLPMRGMKESLNVAVAFGIAAYQISDVFAKP